MLGKSHYGTVKGETLDCGVIFLRNVSRFTFHLSRAKRAASEISACHYSFSAACQHWSDIE
jgi:hypothetical protein